MISGITTTFLNIKILLVVRSFVLEIGEASLSRICRLHHTDLVCDCNIFPRRSNRPLRRNLRLIGWFWMGSKAPGRCSDEWGWPLSMPFPYQIRSNILALIRKKLLHSSLITIQRNRLPRVSWHLGHSWRYLCESGGYICEVVVSPSSFNGCCRWVTSWPSHFKINGTNYHINIGGLYNIYNALAAVAVLHYFMSPDVIKRGFDKTRAVFGRQKPLRLGIGMYPSPDQNQLGSYSGLEMIKLAPYPFNLSVLLNAQLCRWDWYQPGSGMPDFEQITQMDIPEINAGGGATWNCSAFGLQALSCWKITEIAELKRSSNASATETLRLYLPPIRPY